MTATYRWLQTCYYQFFDLRRREYGKLAGLFRNCRTILDLGCGTGDFLVHIKDKAVGIDHNLDSVALAQKQRLPVTLGDVLKTPFESGSFDGIFCAHVIEHFDPEHALALLREIDRLLKPGGILVLQTPVLHRGFYNDFTHVKPYHPEAILHYLSETRQTNLPKIGEYQVLKIRYRYADLYVPLLEPGRRPASIVRWLLILIKCASLCVASVGIKNFFVRNGYTLVLQKS
ncbi:MAG: class I SAM-dependent methyltransferase [Candidatus Omnitrophica bacterium]|nr:class I SAM-dependent methyltransferase [Candidatus Omnitrophota bacterium]MDD5670464.1 class I SAM-dependent methyltransferase [Candidatus Omnitrophota bacterium]